MAYTPFFQPFHKRNNLITTLKGLQSLRALSKMPFDIELLGIVAVRELSKSSAKGMLIQGKALKPICTPI